MDRVCIDKVLLDPVTMNEAVERVNTMIHQERERAAHVVTMNAQFVEIAHHEPRFADVLRRSDLSVADGLPLVWASRFLGRSLPERVAGADLMVRLCEAAAAGGSTVYFLGGSPGAAFCSSKRLCDDFPGLMVTGVDCPPHGFLNDPDQCAQVAKRIELAKPDLLFVGLGAPKQEYWIERHVHLPTKVMMGIGGSFELVAGFRNRAPLPIQQAGFEWLWRLCIEPRRLWKRYLIGNTRFILFVFNQWWKQTLNAPRCRSKTDQALAHSTESGSLETEHPAA
jgi:N-acetylglucosaminyldiphosphoundecaprenol N-acetyl-beta-D-mannosaminyltransferase